MQNLQDSIGYNLSRNQEKCSDAELFNVNAMTKTLSVKAAEEYESRYFVLKEYNTTELVIVRYLEEMGCSVIGKHDRSMVWWRRDCADNGVPIICYERLEKIYDTARKYFMRKELLGKEA